MRVCIFRRVRPHELVSTDVTHPHFVQRKNIRSHIRDRSCFCIVLPAAACIIAGRSRSRWLSSSEYESEREAKYVHACMRANVRACIVRRVRSLLRTSRTFLPRFDSRRLFSHRCANLFVHLGVTDDENRAASSSSFSVMYAYRAASRVYVPIKSFSNFARRDVGARAPLL